MTDHGIDMSQSGWERATAPPPPRPEVAPPKVEDFCDAEGPGGWVCDRKPHQDDNHQADTGEGPVKWRTEMADVTTLADRAAGREVLIPGRIIAGHLQHPANAALVLAGIGQIVDDALKADRPTAWAAALEGIKAILDDAR